MSLFDSIDSTDMDEDNMMAAALNTLNVNLARLGANRVPPPAIYNGGTSVTTFFAQFERYCSSIYGDDDKQAWLQILPSYTEGEVRSMVQSFGMDTYVRAHDTIMLFQNQELAF